MVCFFFTLSVYKQLLANPEPNPYTESNNGRSNQMRRKATSCQFLKVCCQLQNLKVIEQPKACQAFFFLHFSRCITCHQEQPTLSKKEEMDIWRYLSFTNSSDLLLAINLACQSQTKETGIQLQPWEWCMPRSYFQWLKKRKCALFNSDYYIRILPVSNYSRIKL